MSVAPTVSVWSAAVPVMVGATAGVATFTDVASSVAGAPKALLLSLSANVVVADASGVPAAGVNTSASSSLAIGARRAGQRVDVAGRGQAREGRPVGERACARSA